MNQLNEPNEVDDVQATLNEFLKFERDELASHNNVGLSFEEARQHLPPWQEKVKQLFPPFPYFGGKRNAAREVWRRFGADIKNYIEPFAGGMSVLLNRPIFDMRRLRTYRELANDTDLFLTNFWRTVCRSDNRKLIKLMEFPAGEFELLARRKEMIRRSEELRETLNKSIKSFDAELVAYWLYVQRQWIGGGADDVSSSPKLKMVRARECGLMTGSLEEDLTIIKARTRHIRFFQGDWQRAIISATQTVKFTNTGVFLDPPYVNQSDMYKGRLDPNDPLDAVPLAARDWALEFGQYSNFRIAYCGYRHHHDHVFPTGKNGWVRYPWQLKNGMSKPIPGEEREIDMIWFSPHCLRFENDAIR